MLVIFIYIYSVIRLSLIFYAIIMKLFLMYSMIRLSLIHESFDLAMLLFF